jgi:predicted alpha/beta-hydrolase family hydrolase
MIVHAVRIADGGDILEGDLHIPEDAVGLVIFAHGSGSSRFSSRNRHVAESLHRQRFATLLWIFSRATRNRSTSAPRSTDSTFRGWGVAS